jgi:hypothetical protein
LLAADAGIDKSNVADTKLAVELALRLHNDGPLNDLGLVSYLVEIAADSRGTLDHLRMIESDYPAEKVIQHPLWCVSAGPETERAPANGHDTFAGPVESDTLHRARTLHVEAEDSTVTLCMVQPFEMHEGRVNSVSEPVIEIAVINHAMLDSDASTWLNLTDARKLYELLGHSISDFERGYQLRAGKIDE